MKWFAVLPTSKHACFHLWRFQGQDFPAEELLRKAVFVERCPKGCFLAEDELGLMGAMTAGIMILPGALSSGTPLISVFCPGHGF